MIESNNYKLKSFLDKIKVKLNNAETMDDIIDIVQEMETYDSKYKLKFDNTFLYIILTCLLAITASFNVNYCKISIGACLILMFIIFKRFFYINKIFKEIFTKALFLKYGLNEVYIKDFYNIFCKKFRDFHRGDRGRKIVKLMKGYFNFKGKKIRFYYYKFRYIEIIETTETDDDGFIRTEEVEYIYYRYGFLFNVPLSLNLYCGDLNCYYLPEKWTSSSPEFNRLFNVKTDNLIMASKFLTPSTVLKFCEIANYFKKFSFEIVSTGEVCISFNNDIFNEIKKRININNLQNLKKAIHSQLEIKHIAYIEDFINSIFKEDW